MPISSISSRNSVTHDSEFEDLQYYNEAVELQKSIEIGEIEGSLLNLGLGNNKYAETKEEEDIIERFLLTATGQSVVTQASQDDLEIDIARNEDAEDIRGSLVGFTANTWEEIYERYKIHACAIGFGVRKSSTRYTQGSNRRIRSKEFVCSKQGFRCKPVAKRTPPTPKFTTEESTNQQQKKKRKAKEVPITRTGCSAYLRAKLNDNGTWEVDEHVIKHNHELTRDDLQHFERSERKMTTEKAQAIDLMMDSGLRPAQSFNLMSHEAGDIQSVGHTLKDHYNYISRKKMKEIEGGDAQNVIEGLYQRKDEDPNYFFRFKLNGCEKGNKLTAIYWRDSQMLEDYKIYGDILVFDTTFRTNKYNLICAPIVGINNHWQNVMFGCAFIANETKETFEWVLQTLMKSMGGVEPITIFTDQDLAMAKAIEKVLPNTRHRLCIWHLIKNAVSRFGALKKDAEFKNVFGKCLRGCVTPEEFEECWHNMISTYNLQEKKWFKRLYNLKEKWCTALSKDFFSAGVLSSQRSESTNSAVGFKAKKSTSLTDFFKIFDQTIQRWRRNESHADFKCANSQPSTKLPMFGLLKHASEIYTQTIFREFEAEFEYAIGCLSTCIDEIGKKWFVYEVWIEKKEKSKHLVTFDSEKNVIECRCKNFEEVGWLCYHCIRVLMMHSVTTIPDNYIKKRWTKLAKSEFWGKKAENETEFEKLQKKYKPWRTMMARISYNLILKSQEHSETRKIFEQNLKCTAAEIDLALSTKLSEHGREMQLEEKINNDDKNTDELEEVPVVCDPEKANTKGRSKRVKSHNEKVKQPSQKKTKAMKAQAEGREFGSKTPIQKPTLI